MSKTTPNAVGLAHYYVLTQPWQHVSLLSVYAEALQRTDEGPWGSEEQGCSDSEGCATSPLQQHPLYYTTVY